jgi:hypothetical protein
MTTEVQDALSQCVKDIEWFCGGKLNPMDSKGYKMAKAALGEMQPEPEPTDECAACGAAITGLDLRFMRPEGWHSRYRWIKPGTPTINHSRQSVGVCCACHDEKRTANEDVWMMQS